ncbi:MAG: hypothetical protein IJ509_02785 [Bacilli bacterium]|nr:hypothetical protein [Bacilli bacterium]
MEYTTKLNYDLVDSKSLPLLFGEKFLINRAKSADIDFVGQYYDEYIYLYIYDLLALVIAYNMNKETSSNDNQVCCDYSDNEISNFIAKSFEQVEEVDEVDEEYVLLSELEYIKLIENIKNYPISNELLDSLICLYIYNEAYIENDFQVNCYASKLGKEKCNELNKKNMLIKQTKEEMKALIVNKKTRSRKR